MKKSLKKYERLSAYIDGELFEDEKKQLEEELKKSKELRKKLTELKKIKQLTIQSVNTIEENPYFETRLAANIRLKKPFFRGTRKWFPVIGVAVITTILMIVLKLNPGIMNNLLNSQKSNIKAFYKQNLKPLLYAADLSNEDIFNFAFFHRLPLDERKNQFLQLGSDPNGHRYFEIKTAAMQPANNNLNKFVKRLKLNKKQQLQVDSILTSYAGDLQNQILVNNKNTIAINPNLWNYNKALTADLLTFAVKSNKKQFDKAVPSGFSKYNKTVAQLVHEVKASKSNQYIFFTPDTIFSDSFNFDMKKFKHKIEKMKKELKSNVGESAKRLNAFKISFNFDTGLVKLKRDSSWDKHFKVYFDTNSCTVHLGDIPIPNIRLPHFDSFLKKLDETANKFKVFSFDIPPDFRKGGSKSYSFKYHYNNPTKSYDFNFKTFRFGPSGKSNNYKPDSLFTQQFKRFKNNPDSLASIFKRFFNGSTMIFQGKQFQKQMLQLQKEMDKFRKEIQNMKKEFKIKIPPKKKSNTIII